MPAAPVPRSSPQRAGLRDLVPLRPQGAVALTDRASHLVRTRAGDLLGVSLAVQLPIWLLLAIVLRHEWAGGLGDNAVWFWLSGLPDASAGLFLAGDGVPGDTARVVLGRALPSIGLAVTGATYGLLVRDWSAGRPTRGLDALGQVVRRGHRILALWAVVHLLEVVTVVGLLVGPVAFGVAAPLLTIEGQGPLATIRRSWHLSWRRVGHVVNTVVVVTLVSNILGFVVGGLSMLVLYGITQGWVDLGGTAATAMAGALPRLVIDPLLAATMALLALDLKVRVDAVDLEEALLEVRGEHA